MIDIAEDLVNLDLLAMEANSTWQLLDPTDADHMAKLAHVLAQLEADAYDLQKRVAKECQRLRQEQAN